MFNDRESAVLPAAKNLIKTLQNKGIHDQRVLNAIATIPRHLFVTDVYRDLAYEDTALPIIAGQTISQPYIVARMTELLIQRRKLKKALEIGTGSAYQAVVLSRCVLQVYSIERIQALYEHAENIINSFMIKNIFLKYGDGNKGWSEYAPYDGIIITAAASEIPNVLLQQLADGGRLIMPVGDSLEQTLVVVEHQGQYFQKTFYDPVRFVPLLAGKQ